MAKKSSKISLIYLIGMALSLIGFCVPMFKGKLIGKTWNGFKFINFDNFGFVTVGALLILIGIILGIVFSLISVKDVLKLVALIVSIVGGIVLVIGFNQDKLYQAIAKGFLKCAYVGFYLLIVGWIVSIVGYVLKK